MLSLDREKPSMHLLGLDDQPQFLTLLKAMLAKFQHQIDTTIDPFLALNLLPGDPAYDGIFSDYNFQRKDINGVSFAKLARQVYAGPIVMVTGQGEENEVTEALHTGLIAHVMHKPYRAHNLLEALEVIKEYGQTS